MITYIYKAIIDGRVVYLFRAHSNWKLPRIPTLANILDNPSVEWDAYRDEDDIEMVGRNIEYTSTRVFGWLDQITSPNLYLYIWWNNHLETYKGVATIDHASFLLQPTGMLVREYRGMPVLKMRTLTDVLWALDNLHLK